MTNEMLRDALHGIADRAVQPPEGIAERALRQASRRRATRMTSAVVGTIAAVAVPLLFLNLTDDGKQAPPALKPSVTSSPRASAVKLPDNTPAQQRLAKTCVPRPEPEARLLARSVRSVKNALLVGADGLQYQFVLVGNEKNHWTCLLNAKGKMRYAFFDDQTWDPNKISAPLTILRSRGVV